MDCIENVKIKGGYLPGSVGRIAELHGVYYHENWDFELYFETKVAVELSEFMRRYNKEQDRLFTAVLDKRIEGSIVIDGLHSDTKGAHLRWFIVSNRIRGKGVGSRLIEKAVCFCRERKYKKIYLWTFEGLDAAKHLYLKQGFELAEQREGIHWGKRVNEQRFELTMSP